MVGVFRVRKDSSQIQVHRIAQFYRKRRQGVLDRPKTPHTQSSLKFAGNDSVILISVCVSASLLRPYVDYIFKQNTQVSKIKVRLTYCNRKAENLSIKMKTKNFSCVCCNELKKTQSPAT